MAPTARPNSSSLATASESGWSSCRSTPATLSLSFSPPPPASSTSNSETPQHLVHAECFWTSGTYFAVQTDPFSPLLLHHLAHGLGDVHALAMVPFLARVAADHEAVVVRLVAYAPELVGVIVRLVFVVIAAVQLVAGDMLVVQWLLA